MAKGKTPLRFPWQEMCFAIDMLHQKYASSVFFSLEVSIIPQANFKWSSILLWAPCHQNGFDLISYIYIWLYMDHKKEYSKDSPKSKSGYSCFNTRTWASSVYSSRKFWRHLSLCWSWAASSSIGVCWFCLCLRPPGFVWAKNIDIFKGLVSWLIKSIHINVSILVPVRSSTITTGRPEIFFEDWVT